MDNGLLCMIHFGLIIFEEIYLKAPIFLKDLSDNPVGIDNSESIHEKIDFKKIDTKFKNGEYCFISDAIKDIRAVFLNCHSLYSARSNHTKQSLELEKLLEEKISYLDKKYKLLADVNLTFNVLNMEEKPSSKNKYPKDCYDSVLLQSVAHCRPERLNKDHKTFSTTLTTDKDNAHIFEKILSWENKVNFNDIFHQYISSMWELPEIGNFLAIVFKKLDLDIINQGEIERMFFMPKESTTMGKVMTTLLMPVKRTKSVCQVMPYKVWSEKLSKKVSDWCKVYHSENQNKVIAMNLLGIHPDFWTVVNEKNPLIEKDYSELSYFIKVWLVKGLCDYVAIKFKTIRDIVTNCNAKQCTIWKNDLETEEYFFFDSMPDLRIYYYNVPYDEPSLEFLDSVKIDNEVVQFEDNLTMGGFSDGFHSMQKGKHFKLIADSVESLRVFVNELIDMEGLSVPKSLKSSLEKFIVNIEPEEYKYIVMNNDSKIKLFKDLVSYSDRIQKDKDNISVKEEKYSKSKAKDKNEELIISEERQRKLIVHQNVDLNESDEYVSENDKSLSDFTDSEDEWGAMNQPKFKVKQPRQTPSKLFLQLEKRVSEANKMLKVDTNNLLDTYQSDERNQHNITLVSSKNVSLLKEKNSKSFDQAKNEELIISEKRQRKLIVHQNVDLNESDEYVSENDKSLSDFTDSEDEWGAMNQPKFKVKQPRQTPSKLFLQLEKRVSEANKMLKVDTNNLLDTYQSDERNQHNITLVSSKNVSLLKEKNSKSLDQAQYNGVIWQERLRKLVGKQDVETDKYYENNESIPDFTYSKDEWCVMNQPKNKVKQPRQTLSKHPELETQLLEAGKMLKCDTNQSDVKRFRDEDIISKHCTHKNKSIKSVKLMKTQNEGKICSSNTNTLPLVNGNNKVKQPLQIPSKRIKLEKRLKQESTILKDKSIKGFDKKDKSVKSFKLLKTHNEVKVCSNNTNTFVNGHNQSLVPTKNIDIVCSYEKAVLIDSDKKESQKSPDSVRRVEIIDLDEGMQNDCEVFNDNFESSMSTCTENKNRKSNEQNNHKQIESAVISIVDDDQTIISDDEDTVKLISIIKKPKCSPLQNSKPCSLKTNLNKSYNSVSANRRITPSNYTEHDAKSSIIHKFSQNVTIMPANVNIPKGIEITMVKTPPARINSNFNSIKRKSTMLNDHLPDNPSIINVKCELISKPNLNGEVKFYVKLPNGKEHPGPNELINQYLKQHNNQLPDYWLVPLPVEIAKQYGFN